MNFLKNLFKKKQVVPELPKETPKEAKEKLVLQTLRVKAKLLSKIPLNTHEGIINLDVGTEIFVDIEKHIGQYGFYDFGMKKEEYKVLYAN